MVKIPSIIELFKQFKYQRRTKIDPVGSKKNKS